MERRTSSRLRDQRRAHCRIYILHAGSIEAAKELARRRGFAAPIAAWGAAMQQVIEERGLPQTR